MNSIIRIWKSKGEIIEGIKNSIFTKEDVEAIAKERMSICNGCEHIDNTGDKCLVSGTQPCCSLCGCKLFFKTRSLASSCPASKWSSELTEDEAQKLEQKLGM